MASAYQPVWHLGTRASWAQVLYVVPESTKLGYQSVWHMSIKIPLGTQASWA